MLFLPLFHIILYRTFFPVMAALIGLNSIFACIAACYATLLAELFPTQIRYTGIAFIYNISFAIAGSTPLLMTFLIKQTHQPILIAYCLMALAIASILGTLSIKLNSKASDPS